ncbi:MAG: VWA domain-containing protein [Acidobacteriaceae bacterium]
MMKLRFHVLFAAAMAALLVGAGYACAQTTPSAGAPPPVSDFPDTTQQGAKPEVTFKVNSSLVSLFFTARDKHNGLVPTLSRSDCSVSEDKQPQTIKDFTAETDLPLTLGILLDTSGSQQTVLPLEQQAGGRFLHQILRPKDEAFVVTFDVDVDLAQDFTNNVDALSRALDKATINTAGGNGAGGIPGIGQGPFPTQGDPKGTLLYDAVAEASKDKLSTETGRKALILLTDGEDLGSITKPNGAIEAAQKANAIVYVILIADRWGYYNSGMMYTGSSQMKRLADATGGRVIDVGNNGRKLEDAFDEIQRELRTQYLVSYVPKDKDLDGGFRKVDIQCKGDGLKIQARKGYYAIGNMN